MAFKIFLMSATLRLQAGQTNVIYFPKKGDIEMFEKFMNRRVSPLPGIFVKF